jgi:hypothetical protein
MVTCCTVPRPINIHCSSVQILFRVENQWNTAAYRKINLYKNDNIDVYRSLIMYTFWLKSDIVHVGVRDENRAWLFLVDINLSVTTIVLDRMYYLLL